MNTAKTKGQYSHKFTIKQKLGSVLHWDSGDTAQSSAVIAWGIFSDLRKLIKGDIFGNFHQMWIEITNQHTRAPCETKCQRIKYFH